MGRPEESFKMRVQGDEKKEETHMDSHNALERRRSQACHPGEGMVISHCLGLWNRFLGERKLGLRSGLDSSMRPALVGKSLFVCIGIEMEIEG